ncbi:MAG TPA: hypothetical protein VD836_19140 [Solirubrobacteraceae bacterium]|nr:hypothetical protein [Solirubrobacteraceae bacterium]
MRRTVALATGALCLALPWAAHAQEPGTEVGGTVEETLALGLDRVTGFATFPPGPDSVTLAIDARVTTTGRAALDVEDAASPGSRAAGRMRGGDGLLDSPLEGRAGDAFRPLDRTWGEPLAAFSRPVAAEPVRIVLRQRIVAGERPSGTYEKTLLLTLSTGTP